MIMSSSQLSH